MDKWEKVAETISRLARGLQSSREQLERLEGDLHELKLALGTLRESPPTKPTRKSIPKALRNLVWNKYIGEEIGKTRCCCCDDRMISQQDFACGHVVAVARGGHDELDNLRPICNPCNLSMGTQNMDEFRDRLHRQKGPPVKLVDFHTEKPSFTDIFDRFKFKGGK